MDTAIIPNSHLKRKLHLDNLHLKSGVTFTEETEMPLLHPCYSVPESLVAFHAAISGDNGKQCVHFFIDDYQFERIWNNPLRYLPRLKSFRHVISPDFSQYIDMPYPQRMWNNYRGKFIGAIMQKSGIDIIPNVTWSLPDSFSYCFDGIPTHSVIAINSMGVARHGFSKFLWLRGYREALRRLQPVHIVRYGPRVPGEDRTISTYFHNERMIQLRQHGR